MHIPQSSPQPHQKVQRLSRENQVQHTGIHRAWIIFCSYTDCPNYQVLDYIPKGEMGTRAHAILTAALKNWDVTPTGDTCACPTHKGLATTRSIQDVFRANAPASTPLESIEVGS